MDSLISDSIVHTIIDQLKELQTITNGTERLHTINSLFDGEENLIKALQEILAKAVEDINNSGNNAAEKSRTIQNAITTAMLTGFLSERYTRDVIMDKSSKVDNTLFKREYESIKAYIGRIANSNRKSLKEIATKAGDEIEL